MSSILDCISGHDPITAHMYKLNLGHIVNNTHTEETMDSLSRYTRKTAADKTSGRVGMGTVLGAGLGGVGGGIAGNKLMKLLGAGNAGRVIGAIAGGIAGGTAGGVLGYKADKPQESDPYGRSFMDKISPAVAYAGLGGLGGLSGALAARYFGDSTNPAYITGGAAGGAGLGLLAAYALADQFASADELSGIKPGKGTAEQRRDNAMKQVQKLREPPNWFGQAWRAAEENDPAYLRYIAAPIVADRLIDMGGYRRWVNNRLPPKDVRSFTSPTIDLLQAIWKKGLSPALKRVFRSGKINLVRP